ncbi:MAG: PorT family protein [Flavobacterium sp.]|nr:PorT family protein [Flavobacterium sp.]
MKKLILAAAAVFAFGATNAQDMKFGVKAGLNVSNLSTTVPAGASVDALYGANFGVFGDFKVSDKFSVQPEILYSMQGAKLVASGSGFNYEEKQSTNYINIPIMAKFFVIEKLSLQAGPQIGFLMSAKADVTTNFPGFTNGSTDVKSNYNSVDFGFNLGAGYDITENIAVDLRYNLGLSELEKTVPAGTSASKNRVFSLNFGYKF